VNSLTGEGLADALEGASVVVDVSNSPSFADADVLDFFTRSTKNLLAAEASADVGHHVALSIVGADRLPDSGYLRAKVAQEQLIVDGSVPYSIVHATQFFEFFKGIAQGSTVDDEIRLPPGLVQPIAAREVADFMTEVATATALDGTVEIGGPEAFGLDEFIRRGLAAHHDPRTVVTDPEARYFGTVLTGRELTPADGARLGTITFDTWLESDIRS
jgi:uncharacterized protein YbjT (DUF2867 family)